MLELFPDLKQFFYQLNKLVDWKSIQEELYFLLFFVALRVNTFANELSEREFLLSCEKETSEYGSEINETMIIIRVGDLLESVDVDAEREVFWIKQLLEEKGILLTFNHISISIHLLFTYIVLTNAFQRFSQHINLS